MKAFRNTSCKNIKGRVKMGAWCTHLEETLHLCVMTLVSSSGLLAMVNQMKGFVKIAQL